ncbi:MAG: hypothetical protein R6X33_03140 [Candidatus Brocadiia bacterium]
MRLCSYVVKHDTGFAPNPFWGYCTLAACTPNHVEVKLEAGDWIVGGQTKAAGRRLIHAMRVAETLDFDDYYRDGRFQRKKPRPGDGWKWACGDNIYFRDDDGSWRQDGEARFHTTERELRQDLRHPTVFVAEEFYYFGEDAVVLPERFRPLLWDRQGCSCKHDAGLVSRFLNWVRGNHDRGVQAPPAHRRVTKIRARRRRPPDPGCDTDSCGQQRLDATERVPPNGDGDETTGS